MNHRDRIPCKARVPDRCNRLRRVIDSRVEGEYTSKGSAALPPGRSRNYGEATRLDEWRSGLQFNRLAFRPEVSVGSATSIEIQSLCKSYTLGRSRSLNALEDVDLQLQAGEFVALL